MRLFRITALIIGFVTLTGAIVSAQSTAQISGTARDQSGGVLPGVEVSLTQTNTGLVRTVVTNETGSYSWTVPAGGRLAGISNLHTNRYRAAGGQ